MGTRYDTDFVAWSVEQAALLRAARFSELDLENLAEEIEDVGKAERHELESRLQILITHLLKWCFQPGLRSGSWRASIEEQRAGIGRRLNEAPSLKHEFADQHWLLERWKSGVRGARSETGLRCFPEAPLWTVKDILDEEFWPN